MLIKAKLIGIVGWQNKTGIGLLRLVHPVTHKVSFVPLKQCFCGKCLEVVEYSAGVYDTDKVKPVFLVLPFCWFPSVDTAAYLPVWETVLKVESQNYINVIKG